MEKTLLKVSGMTCGNCVKKLETVLNGLDGVQQAKVDLENGAAKVKYDESKQSPESLSRAVSNAGYQTEPTK
ncbi:heavy-metal-associated domain-containing protein [Rossellomorea arthrocnemi]|uniref:heavy-metal-associated domain-containing protein n=1 Tax=Rossellomorea arthrocnemi TaxID=2769542 RepID=UPI001917BF12|nr:cation transporter [Rossellomorea arthrocnemi]